MEEKREGGNLGEIAECQKGKSKLSIFSLKKSVRTVLRENFVSQQCVLTLIRLIVNIQIKYLFIPSYCTSPLNTNYQKIFKSLFYFICFKSSWGHRSSSGSPCPLKEGSNRVFMFYDLYIMILMSISVCVLRFGFLLERVLLYKIKCLHKRSYKKFLSINIYNKHCAWCRLCIILHWA